MPSDPDWLVWVRELQAIAQTGLAFARDPYDRERYLAVRSLAADVAASYTGDAAARIEALFAAETGYAILFHLRHSRRRGRGRA